LEIEWTRGSKGKEDRIYLITTKEKEPITIFKLALLVNQLAVNEISTKSWLDLGKEPLYFEEFIDAAIRDAKNGIDWAEPKNEQHIIELCDRFHLTPEKIDFDLLRKTQQRYLEEFFGGKDDRNQFTLEPR